MDLSNSSIYDLQLLLKGRIELYQNEPSESLAQEIAAIDKALKERYAELVDVMDNIKRTAKRQYLFMIILYAAVFIAGAIIYLALA